MSDTRTIPDRDCVGGRVNSRPVTLGLESGKRRPYRLRRDGKLSGWGSTLVFECASFVSSDIFVAMPRRSSLRRNQLVLFLFVKRSRGASAYNINLSCTGATVTLCSFGYWNDKHRCLGKLRYFTGSGSDQVSTKRRVCVCTDYYQIGSQLFGLLGDYFRGPSAYDLHFGD